MHIFDVLLHVGEVFPSQINPIVTSIMQLVDSVHRPVLLRGQAALQVNSGSSKPQFVAPAHDLVS